MALTRTTKRTRRPGRGCNRPGTIHNSMTLWRQIGIAAIMAALTATAAAQDVDPFSELRASVEAAAGGVLERAEAELPGAKFDRQEQSPDDETTSDDRLRTFAQRYWGGRVNATKQALARVTSLRPALLPILREEGAPEALLAVVLVESAGRSEALSPKGARGLWQFMPDTARGYGLHVTAAHDERLDVVRATRAAARHLRDLYAEFESWELALAAYNYGAGGVRRAISKTGTTDFQRLAAARALPAETRAYVPAVADAIRLLKLPDLHTVIEKVNSAHVSIDKRRETLVDASGDGGQP